MTLQRTNQISVLLGMPIVLAIGSSGFLLENDSSEMTPPSQVETAKARGLSIIDAIQAHRRVRGAYPATLEELVPEFLASIEPPLGYASEWRYGWGSPEDGLSLSFTEDDTYFHVSSHHYYLVPPQSDRLGAQQPAETTLVDGWQLKIGN